MEVFESKPTIIGKSAHELFVPLADLRNYDDLMPPNVNFEANENECNFNVPPIGKLQMVVSERIAYSEIRIVQGNKSPFPFTLNVRISEADTGFTEVQIVFNTELPFMFKAMAAKPIQQFTDSLAKRISEKYG